MAGWAALFAVGFVLASADSECQGESCAGLADEVALLQLREQASGGLQRLGAFLRPEGSDEAEEPRDFLHVNATLSPDESFAEVHFVLRSGDRFLYKLRPTSIFSEGSKIHAYTGPEKEEHRIPTRRAFSSSTQGLSAKAVLEADGSVSGLFQLGPHVLQLRRSVLAGEGVAALQTAAGVKHTLRVLHLSELVLGEAAAVPELIVDGDYSNLFGRGLPGATRPPPIMMPSPGDQEPTIEVGRNIIQNGAWQGTRWFPHCYGDDTHKHVFKVGVAADYEAFKSFGGRLQSILEDIVLQSSMVYELQLNIRLEIGDMRVYEYAAPSPSYAAGCPQDFMTDKLNALRADSSLSFQGAWHLFTDCGNDYGTVGLAYIGVMCDRVGNYNKGVDQIRGRGSRVVEDSWLTFAHELGHNLHGHHSFEKGQGKTGGIMDYGDGKLNGVYQFNTMYRRQEMCQHISSTMNRCGDRFVLARESDSSGGSGGHPSGAGRTFELRSGDCTVSGDCVQSANWPRNYENDESCTIVANVAGLKIRVVGFDTEQYYDVLTVNGRFYSGRQGPDGVAVNPDVPIVWQSDFRNTASGFKICFDG